MEESISIWEAIQIWEKKYNGFVQVPRYRFPSHLIDEEAIEAIACSIQAEEGFKRMFASMV